MKNICVYCGSSNGSQPVYREAAVALGKMLAERHIGLVYGGASIGLMGAIADAVLEQGGQVIGVIPHALAKKEVAHDKLTEMHVVASMHERKAKMAEASDGFIALPGGLGTLEELFEMLTWAQLGMHDKPCALLNVHNYYDSLITFLEHAEQEKFIKAINLDMLLVDDDTDRLIEKMTRYHSPVTEQMLSPAET